jgi:hypothetical protein
MNYRNQSFNNQSFNKKPSSKLPIIGAALLLVVSIVVAVYFFFFKKEPIDCVGDWKKNAQCPVDCGLSASKITDTYLVTTPMQYGGTSCAFEDGDIKYIDCPKTELCNGPEYDSTSTYPGTSPDNYKKYCDEMLRKGYCKYENIRENNCRDECNPR